MPPDMALLSTLIGSNYPCLEQIFMVPKVFEPLKFDCIWNGKFSEWKSNKKALICIDKPLHNKKAERLTHCINIVVY